VALNNIILDDKPWSKIAEEARLLIPSFSREWTDHNAHDPGITFLELFAWLGEIQRYRLNRTSAAIRERFLAMAGIQPFDAQPATAIVEFAPSEDSAPQSILVPIGTALSITGRLDLPYQTVRDSYLVASTIIAVETLAGRRELDRTSAQQDDAGHFDAFGPDPKPGDTLLITFKNPIVAPELSLAFRVFDRDLSPVVAGVPISSVVLRWEYSSVTDAWQPLVVVRDTTAALTLTGFVVFQDPGESIARIRATIAAGHYEIPPRLAAIRVNMLEVRQTGLAAPKLETGTGLPDQQRKLPFLPWREEPAPIIQVGPAGAEEDWSFVSDLSASVPTSKHYTFDAATGVVLFGNGFNGAVPGKEDRIVVKPFRYTLGDQGNLNAGMNWHLTAPKDAASWIGTNTQPAAGGSDAELPEDTELRARGEFRRIGRGITAADLETLAIQTPGIRVSRAKALPGWSPLSPCTPTSDDVTVVVLPAARPDLDSQPPSAGFLATVNRYLQGARLVANRLHVIGPEFVSLNLAATVTLKKRALRTDVRRDVNDELTKFFSAQAWPFGRDIFPSEIYQHLANVAGVAFTSKVRINSSSSALELSPIQLPRFESITLQILEARDA
jgi:uncharacterized phage protein gp47/JayE